MHPAVALSSDKYDAAGPYGSVEVSLPCVKEDGQGIFGREGTDWAASLFYWHEWKTDYCEAAVKYLSYRGLMVLTISLPEAVEDQLRKRVAVGLDPLSLS
jgi:hypothetical protein